MFSPIQLRRPELMALLFILATANALLSNIVNEIVEDGIVFSILNTFKISAIVWLAILVVIKYLLHEEDQPVTRTDRWMAVVIVICSLAPLGPAMWIVVSAYALYLILLSRPTDMCHRAGWIIFAVTIPMFWSKRIFYFFAESFLALDAVLVSSITGTERNSNLVVMPGGAGYLQIAAPCSSFANVSIAILCWILFTQAEGERRKARNILVCITACIAVIAINVARISLIGFYPSQYELLHGPIGSAAASWVTVIVVLVVCYYGVGCERLKLI